MTESSLEKARNFASIVVPIADVTIGGVQKYSQHQLQKKKLNKELELQEEQIKEGLKLQREQVEKQHELKKEQMQKNSEHQKEQMEKDGAFRKMKLEAKAQIKNLKSLRKHKSEIYNSNISFLQFAFLGGTLLLAISFLMHDSGNKIVAIGSGIASIALVFLFFWTIMTQPSEE